jgi:hypothetical protein
MKRSRKDSMRRRKRKKKRNKAKKRKRNRRNPKRKRIDNDKVESHKYSCDIKKFIIIHSVCFF